MMSDRSSRRSRLALFALALVLVGAALVSAPAEAVGGCLRSEAITTYYSNAAHSSVVGWCISGCQGGCNCSGTSSKFYTIDHIFCTD
jgi:hypothetical protein